MLRKIANFVYVPLLLVAIATAQQGRIYRDGGNWAQEITGSIAAARNLRVNVDVGSVRIEGGSQPAINYVIHNRSYTYSEDKARREFESYKVTAYVRGDTAFIMAEWQGGSPHRFSGDFAISVPKEIESVKVSTEGGSMSANNLAGRFDGQSGGGSIRLDQIGGAVSAETGGGSIETGDIGGDVNLHTGGGSIKVGSSRGKVNAESGGGSVYVVSCMQGATLETGGGSIHVERCAGRVKATTGGGSVDLGAIDGPVEMSTGGGSIRLTSAKGTVRANTGSGTIELNSVSSARAETGAGGIVARFILNSGDRGDSVLETSAGDITVYVSPNMNLSIRAAIEVANGHSIRSDFPELHIVSEGGDYGPKTVTAEGNLNGGGPILKVRTTTGDIHILRASR